MLIQHLSHLASPMTWMLHLSTGSVTFTLWPIGCGMVTMTAWHFFLLSVKPIFRHKLGVREKRGERRSVISYLHTHSEAWHGNLFLMLMQRDTELKNLPSSSWDGSMVRQRNETEHRDALAAYSVTWCHQAQPQPRPEHPHGIRVFDLFITRLQLFRLR